MKKFMMTVTIMVVVIFGLFGQEPLTYTEVVQVDSVSQNELYNRAKVWFATAYNSSNDVLQIDNKEGGEFIGKAVLDYIPNVHSGSAQTKGNIKYTIKIFVKEGRYKYIITDFIHDPFGNNFGKSSMGLITNEIKCPNPKPFAKNWSNKVWSDIKAQIETNIISLIENLKESMLKTTESGNDDW